MQLNVGVRAKHAPPANHFATRKLESTEPHQLLLNHIAQLLYCCQVSKLSISGPLLHVVQVLWSPLDAHIPYLVELEPYWQVELYFLGGVYPDKLHLLELVLSWRFDSCWFCASYLPSIATKHRLLPPFLLYFLSPPGRQYRLSPQYHVTRPECAASMYSQLLHATHIRHQEGARQWWFG